jgi:DNA-directed RNA polymerase
MLRATTTGISRYTARRINVRSSTSSTQSVLLPFLYPSSIPRNPRWLRNASTTAKTSSLPGSPSAQQNTTNRERPYSTYPSIPIPDGIEDVNGIYLRTGRPDGGALDAHTYQPARPTADAPSLVIVDTPRLPDTPRKKPRIINGISEDKHELLATYEACVKVGRIARAQLMLNAITSMLDRSSPLLAGAHNTFLKALLQRALVGSNQDSLRVFFTWYEDTMRRELGITGDATTMALLLQGSLAVKETGLRDRYVRRYIEQWKEQGREIKDVFALSIMADDQVVEVCQVNLLAYLFIAIGY